MNAADVMTRDIFTVAPGTSLVEAIQLMLKVRVSGLPVVDGLGRLVGLLTEATCYIGSRPERMCCR